MNACRKDSEIPSRTCRIFGVISLTMLLAVAAGDALAQDIPTGATHDLRAGSWKLWPEALSFAGRGTDWPGGFDRDSGDPDDLPGGLVARQRRGFVAQAGDDPGRALERIIVEWTTRHLPYLWHVISGSPNARNYRMAPFGITEFSLRKRRVALERALTETVTVTLSLKEEHHRLQYDHTREGERFHVVALAFEHRFR
jgi:hypothetical protein